MNRKQAHAAILLGPVILLGLSTRSFPGIWPDAVATYGGDTLWAVALVLALRWFRHTWGLGRLAAVAAGIAVCIELTQLCHPPWLDALREYQLCALVLGHWFVWSDLVCSAAGIGLGLGCVKVSERLQAA